MIIIGGFLGLEVAASAVALGCEVTVLEAGPNVLGRGVSPGVASALSEFHRSEGVNIETDIIVREITGDKTQTRVICAVGAEFSADVVIVGIGILPNTEVLDAAGLECADGICVDEFGEAAPNIYAAGDVARRMSPRAGYAVRMETWENADVQAGLAARNMNGEKTSCDIVPWFWTDQYDQNHQVIGMRGPNDQMVVRGELSERQAMVFHLRNNRVTAAELLNSGRERRQVKRLIELEIKIDPRLLSDPDISISAVIEPAGAS